METPDRSHWKTRSHAGGNLWVKLHSAAGLKAHDLNGKSDPYVKFKLKDFGTEDEVKSSVKNETLTPVWEETIALGTVSPEQLLHQKLVVTVMDQNSGKAHELFSHSDGKIGECTVMLTPLESGSHELGFKSALSPKGTVHFTVIYKPPKAGRVGCGLACVGQRSEARAGAGAGQQDPMSGSPFKQWLADELDTRKTVPVNQANGGNGGFDEYYEAKKRASERTTVMSKLGLVSNLSSLDPPLPGSAWLSPAPLVVLADPLSPRNESRLCSPTFPSLARIRSDGWRSARRRRRARRLSGR